MVISHSQRFVFIHNYKVAGSSLTSELKKYGVQDSPYSRSVTVLLEKLPYNLRETTIKLLRRLPFINFFENHYSASDIKKIIGDDHWDEFYSFGLVRNPWDWQVSLYHYMKQSPWHYQHELVNSMSSFDEYIEWRCSKEPYLQKDFFYENEKPVVKYIEKMENISELVKTINNQLDVHIELVHKNKSDHNNYKNYYNQKTWDKVKEVFKEDIKLFGYEEDSLDNE